VSRLPSEHRSPLRPTWVQMRLLHDTTKKHRKSSSSPNLYHALVGASTNSTIAPIGFRLRSDTDPLVESTGGRI